MGRQKNGGKRTLISFHSVLCASVVELYLKGEDSK